MASQRIVRHLILPSFAPAALVWLYFTPKTAFGCANRGYMALAVVFLALVAAIATAMKGAAARRHGEKEEADWWTLKRLFGRKVEVEFGTSGGIEGVSLWLKKPEDFLAAIGHSQIHRRQPGAGS